MRKRCTLQISLVLVGVVALAGCGPEEKRHVYKSRQDCLDDWGGNEKDCQEAPRGTSHYSMGYFYGPRYGGILYGGQGSRSISSVPVSRGGFGSLSRFHSSFGG